MKEIINFKHLRTLNISKNKGSNNCVEELITLLTTSYISVIDISSLELTDKNIDKIGESLVKRF